MAFLSLRSAMFLTLTTAIVSSATLALQLLDRPANQLKSGVLLLELFLRLPQAGLCVSHLVLLKLVLGNGLPLLHVLCLTM